MNNWLSTCKTAKIQFGSSEKWKTNTICISRSTMIAALCVQVGNDLRDYGKHWGLGSLSHTTHRGIDHHLQQKPRGLVSHPREKRESLYWEAQKDLGEYISKTAGLSDHCHSKHWRQKYPLNYHTVPRCWSKRFLRNNQLINLEISLSNRNSNFLSPTLIHMHNAKSWLTFKRKGVFKFNYGDINNQKGDKIWKKQRMLGQENNDIIHLCKHMTR